MYYTCKANFKIKKLQLTMKSSFSCSNFDVAICKWLRTKRLEVVSLKTFISHTKYLRNRKNFANTWRVIDIKSQSISILLVHICKHIISITHVDSFIIWYYSIIRLSCIFTSMYKQYFFNKCRILWTSWNSEKIHMQILEGCCVHIPEIHRCQGMSCS